MHHHFEWKAEYCVQHKHIDAQHRRLFMLANRLLETIDDENALANNLVQLYAHTREHFRDEEQLMKENYYAKYHEHRLLHDQMLEKLNNLTINVQKKTPGTKDQLKLFMTEWVLEHILSQDKPLLNPGENTTQAVSFR